MTRMKRRLLKIIIFSGLLLFLYITRSLVKYADNRLTKKYSDIEDDKISKLNFTRGKSHRLQFVSNMNLPNKKPNITLKAANKENILNDAELPDIKAKVFKENSILELGSHSHYQSKKLELMNDSLVTIKGESVVNKDAFHGLVHYYIDEAEVDDANVSYPPFVNEIQHSGPGEWGAAVKLERKEKISSINHGFKQAVSDVISVHRHIEDNRPKECKERIFRKDLPVASVIICFHNEAWSTLLRSVHSVLDRSPNHLLGEIILVDDASTVDYLKKPLKKYMKQLRKVKIIRFNKQQGLIRARLAGYDVAKGPVLVYLDSHIECFPGWLEPLLDRIATNPRNVPFPSVDYINPSTFSTGVRSKVTAFGVFDWKMLTFDWAQLGYHRNDTRPHPTDPIKSPTMPGGLFAIDKSWFTTLGTYDPELLYWGSENMELSFKIWMCNGTIEVVPCSQVGHVFRKKNPIKWERGGNPVLENTFRVAEVWMDEYKHLVYESSFVPSPTIDVSERKKLRDSLKCHDFRWYIQNIFPECKVQPSIVAGEVRSQYDSSYCLDSGSWNKLFPCHGKGVSQYWRLRTQGGLTDHRGRHTCLRNETLVITSGWNEENCTWSYKEGKFYLTQHQLCLTVNSELHLSVEACHDGANQKWKVQRSKFPITP